MEKLGSLNIELGPKPSNDIPKEEETSSEPTITHAWFWPRLGQWLQENDIIITETGTANFGKAFIVSLFFLDFGILTRRRHLGDPIPCKCYCHLTSSLGQHWICDWLVPRCFSRCERERHKTNYPIHRRRVFPAYRSRTLHHDSE